MWFVFVCVYVVCVQPEYVAVPGASLFCKDASRHVCLCVRLCVRVCVNVLNMRLCAIFFLISCLTVIIARSGDDKEVRALDSVTLGIAPGQCLGLLG